MNTERVIERDEHESEMRRIERELGRMAIWSQEVRNIARFAKAIMFFTLGVAALLYASSANAADFASLPNEAGGEIVLTDEAGDSCLSFERISYARSASGMTIFGCWHPGDSFVFVRWKTASGIEVRTYPYGDFVATKQEMRS